MTPTQQARRQALLALLGPLDPSNPTLPQPPMLAQAEAAVTQLAPLLGPTADRLLGAFRASRKLYETWQADTRAMLVALLDETTAPSNPDDGTTTAAGAETPTPETS